MNPWGFKSNHIYRWRCQPLQTYLIAHTHLHEISILYITFYINQLYCLLIIIHTSFRIHSIWLEFRLNKWTDLYFMDWWHLVSYSKNIYFFLYSDSEYSLVEYENLRISGIFSISSRSMFLEILRYIRLFYPLSFLSSFFVRQNFGWYICSPFYNFHCKTKSHIICFIWIHKHFLFFKKR